MWRAFLSLLLFTTAVHAQRLDLQPQVSVSATRLTPGTSFQITVAVNIPAPWHINAHQQTDPTLIPTTLTWDPTPGITLAPVEYPTGKTMKVSWSDQPVGLYAGPLVFTTKAQVTAAAGGGPLKLAGQLRYQACDDETCFAPITLPVTTDVVVAGTASAPVAKSDNVLAQKIRAWGWGLALGVVFLWGLGANLTPCVFPMINITVSYFGGSSSERNVGRAFLSALVYCAGIVLTYSVLGLVAALTGSLFGALLQSPVVLIGIALLLVTLALSMFGLYEIQVPQALLQRATGLSSRSGFVGVFFLGAVLGIIAAPCLTPSVVVLIAFVSQKADAWTGWWVFFVFAWGLALPYLILGTFSGLLHRLPKSGKWMIGVKRFFGVVLLIVAGWFLILLLPKSKPLDPLKIESQLAAAKAAGKPVVLDFFADWCAPCKKMDRETFPDPRVQERLARFAFVKVDLTRTGRTSGRRRSRSVAVEELMRQYEIAGVPTYVFLDPAGKEMTELRQVGFIEADGFVKLLDRALAKK
jgi:thiol:disulfide interchange protein DsbD